jgi:hypothetical protein
MYFFCFRGLCRGVVRRSWFLCGLVFLCDVLMPSRVVLVITSFIIILDFFRFLFRFMWSPFVYFLQAGFSRIFTRRFRNLFWFFNVLDSDSLGV